MATSPTSRTLDRLRRQGYVCEVVERWIPRANVRRDFLGCLDLLAVRSDLQGVLGVQASSAANHSARVKKCSESALLRIWLKAGNRCQVWSWLKDRSGKWSHRISEITLEGLSGVAVADRRRRSQAKAEKGLFD